jgi:hypothetical protein
MIGNAQAKFDENGNLTDDKIREFIRALLEALVARRRLLNAGKA